MRDPAATNLPPALIVVGASARALACSAHRAGIAVHAADLFADADLRDCATTVASVGGPGSTYPDSLVAAVAGFPPVPLCYTGALENHPDIVDRLAADRPLAGNDGRRLRLVRDPLRLARAVRAAGLGFPETRLTAAGLPTDGSFLVKPLASAGGRGIEPWHGGEHRRLDRVVWQRIVRGAAWGAAFAVAAGRARLFGCSRQLVGVEWCGARPFAWCGAVDVPPEMVPAGMRRSLERLGEVLAGPFGLGGLVGADLVVDASGGVHVVEVNPRPTASMELVERARGESVAVTHVAACGLAAGSPRGPAATMRQAKAVLFGNRDLVVDERIFAGLIEKRDRWSDDDGCWPALADLPPPGSHVRAGGPLVTAFAAGRTAHAALAVLRRRADVVRELLRSAPSLSPPAAAVAARPPRRP